MKKLWLMFVSLFRRPVVEVEESPSHLMGDWTLSELLDELPEYHRMLAKNKKYYRTELAPVLKMGPILAPHSSSYFYDKRFANNPAFPSQMFVSFVNPKKISGDDVPPSMVAAMKVDAPLTIERGPGVCYKLLLYVEEMDFWFGGHVWYDGKNVFIPRERRKVMNTIRRNGGHPVHVPGIVYSSPLIEAFDIADDDEHSRAIMAIKIIFFGAVNFWAERDKGWLVISKKDGLRASFAVHEGQHKYFFKDRDKIVTTPTGQRKRIFHLVTGHYRTINGKKKWIKEHKRGQRHFFWHDTECHIFAPGWHGRDIWQSFDATSHYEDEVGEHFGLPASQVAEKFSRVMEGTSARIRNEI